MKHDGSSYLAKWSTLAEASAWLEVETGERWPLPRLLEFGVWPSVWLSPDPQGLDPAVIERVFNGKAEGFLAPICFAGDTQRLAIDRTGYLTMTRTDAGELVRVTPGIAFKVSDLRFPADRLHDLRLRFGRKVGEGVERLKRAELVKRFSSQWTSIESDLREASRNGLAVAKMGGGFWDLAKAKEWARAQGKLSDSAPNLLAAWRSG